MLLELIGNVKTGNVKTEEKKMGKKYVFFFPIN